MFNILLKYKQRLFYKKLIKKNDLCFDIGANIGKKSKLFLSINAKVVAFEPQTKCFKFLEKIKSSSFKFYPYGVGSKNEIKQLNLANHLEVATFSKKMIDFYTTEDLKWHKKEEVNVKKLDTLIEEFGVPHFCKIDTEGFELEILSNLSYTIPIIEFEFNEAFINETILVLDAINNLNNYEFNYILNEFPVWRIKKWVDKNTLNKIIKKLPKNRLHGNIFAKLKNNEQ